MVATEAMPLFLGTGNQAKVDYSFLYVTLKFGALPAASLLILTFSWRPPMADPHTISVATAYRCSCRALSRRSLLLASVLVCMLKARLHQVRLPNGYCTLFAGRVLRRAA